MRKNIQQHTMPPKQKQKITWNKRKKEKKKGKHGKTETNKERITERNTE